jgi:hypothetical protein
VSTDDSFIKDHNDIFNCNVAAYLAAVVEATRSKRPETPPLAGCTHGEKFDLLNCFQAYHRRFVDNRDKFPDFCPLDK